MNSFVLKGNICYSKSKDELTVCPSGYAVCLDGYSKGVFEYLPAEYQDLPLIDYGDALIFPGLVDLHIHASQYSYRGTGMDLELMDWLTHQAFPEEAKFEDLDYAREAYGIFVEAMKKSATSRACIFASRHRPATELLMEQMEAAGLVSYVGKVNMDREAPDGLREESAEYSAAETITWVEHTAGKFKRTKPILTPRFIPSCTNELLHKLKEIRHKYCLPVQSHLSENKGEIEWVRQNVPQATFYGEAYDIFDLFGDLGDSKTLMAHCVWSTDVELELMKKQGVFIVHCPASNTNVYSGIAPMRKYLNEGMKLGLGSDVAGGHTESMFRAISDTIQVSKLYLRMVDQNAPFVTFPEAFWLATKGGGEFFGKVGSFEEDYEFDAVVLDDSRYPHPQEMTVLQRLERAVYLSMDLTCLQAKYVQGEQIF